LRRHTSPTHNKRVRNLPPAITRGRQPANDKLKCRIGSQVIEVAGVLIFAADREHAGAEPVDEPVDDAHRVAPIRNYTSELLGQPKISLGYREKHHTPVRSQAALNRRQP